MKVASYGLFAAFSALICCGCGPSSVGQSAKECTFSNESSSEVTVSPVQLSPWSQFRLPPGESKKLPLGIEEVFYIFDPRARVRVVDDKGDRIRFVDIGTGKQGG